MYVRALIVVLIVLNAGVALWWAMQPPPALPAAPPQPTGVARLEVLPMLATGASRPSLASAAQPEAGAMPASSTPASATAAGADAVNTANTANTANPGAGTASPPAGKPAPPVRDASSIDPATAAATRAPTVPAPSAAPERCASLGAYTARSDADAALTRLRGQVSRASVREDTDAGVSTFRVMLPNVGDRAAAQALVKRIASAGIGDYYVIAQGESNTVALGQYQSRERAERRQASLVSAGFPAQLVPSGSGQSRWWIDVRSTVAAATLQGAAGATRQRSLDCAALR
ncbi:SPOR domain-containing protein [Xanthomonas floridensis]|uniref:SPOR domain-containing protein n=1 Tax=Xanthomonas floridensis TaxID=1843580 RepID=A0A1A9MGU2_9XANT|nr:SPOR domain-containing protein [Xanthomonas floridensis]MEA5124164.1 SPOR domain-containing protein [Xanthomonas floridensis]MEA5131963.1 SPOR domain-containing protein [Xanthomonas floridensis]OAG69046.1 sporulation protein [Xanthomonas floridensis]